MGNLSTTPDANRGSRTIKKQLYNTASYGKNKAKNRKPYPPYGAAMADRLRWKNPPLFVFICVGGDAYASAKHHNRDRDYAAMVLAPGQDPRALNWPVTGCHVVIEWDGSAPAELIIELVKCLLRTGALSVTVWPTWVDHTKPPVYYDITQSPPEWVQTRETLKTYYPAVAS